MRPVVIVEPPRADVEDAARLGAFGVATVHEAIGRRGYLGPDIRPIWPGARIGGTALTVSVPPGDNLMVHVAIEQARPGDILVIAPVSPSTDGYIGELIAEALRHRGVRGVVTGTGVRDVADLRSMAFPAWSTAVSAQGTVKATAGSVNVPVVVGGVLIRPGDVIVADDDGVVTVERTEVKAAIEVAAAREAKEQVNREAFRRGELSLDVNGLRPLVERLGITYVRTEDGEAQ